MLNRTCPTSTFTDALGKLRLSGLMRQSDESHALLRKACARITLRLCKACAIRGGREQRALWRAPANAGFGRTMVPSASEDFLGEIRTKSHYATCTMASVRAQALGLFVSVALCTKSPELIAAHGACITGEAPATTTEPVTCVIASPQRKRSSINLVARTARSRDTTHGRASKVWGRHENDSDLHKAMNSCGCRRLCECSSTKRAQSMPKNCCGVGWAQPRPAFACAQATRTHANVRALQRVGLASGLSALPSN